MEVLSVLLVSDKLDRKAWSLEISCSVSCSLWQRLLFCVRQVQVVILVHVRLYVAIELTFLEVRKGVWFRRLKLCYVGNVLGCMDGNKYEGFGYCEWWEIEQIWLLFTIQQITAMILIQLLSIFLIYCSGLPSGLNCLQRGFPCHRDSPVCKYSSNLI